LIFKFIIELISKLLTLHLLLNYIQI